MSKEVGLREFAVSVNADPKRDMVIPAVQLGIGSGFNPAYPIRLFSESGMISRSDVTMHAADQLYGYVGSGFVSYGRELAKAEQFDLLNTNFSQRMLRDPDKRFLIRGLGDGPNARTRAVLSDAYKRMDTDQVFGAVLPIVDNRDRFQPLGGGRSMTRDYMKFIEKSASICITDARGRKREFSVGFVFSNSEVGAGATMFELFVSDSFCMNGCIFSKKLLAKASFNHRGSRLQSDINGFIDEEIEAERNANILEAIKKAASTAASHDGTAKIRGLLEQSLRPIQAKPSAIVEHVGKALQLSDSTRSKVEEKFFDDGNKSPFGVQAAITAVAQEVDSLDERRQLEKAGGAVLEYPKKFWDALESLEA